MSGTLSALAGSQTLSFIDNLSRTSCSMNRGSNIADKLIMCLHGWDKDYKRQRKKQRERVRENERMRLTCLYYIIVAHLLLILSLVLCSWWNFVSILITSNAGLGIIRATGEHQHSRYSHSPWGKPISPAQHCLNDIAHHLFIPIHVRADLGRVITVQECQVDRYSTMERGRNNHCCCPCDTAQHKIDLVVEFLWDTTSQDHVLHILPLFILGDGDSFFLRLI